MMSRWSSPIPEMTVCPVSSSNFTTNVGSSSASLRGRAQLVLVGLRLRLDGDRDDRRREADGFEDDRVVGVADRVAGRGVLQAHDGDDVARVRRLDVLAVVGVHLQDPTDALLAVLRRVERRGCRSGALPK